MRIVLLSFLCAALLGHQPAIVSAAVPVKKKTARATPKQQAKAKPSTKLRAVKPAAKPKSQPVAQPQPAPPPSPEPLISEAPKPQPDPSPEVKLSFGGMIDAQGIYYPEALSPEVNQSHGILNLEATGSVKVGRSFLYKMRPTAHFDPKNNSESERWWIELPEGYVQLKSTIGEGSTFYGQLGFNTFTWGVTDGFNPVDVVNQRRYLDPLHSEKLGVFSLVTKFDFDGFLAEGIFIPSQRRSKLPDVNSRWLPREIDSDEITQAGITFKLPSNHSFYYRAEEELDNALKYNAGLRLAANVSAADLALYYFNGAATVPATDIKLTSTFRSVVQGKEVVNVNPEIGLKPVFYRVHVAGGSAVLSLGEILFRAETAYTSPISKADDHNLPGNSSESVLELEHTFSGETLGSLTAIVLGTYATHDDPPSSTTSTPSLSRMFDKAVAFGLRWQPVSTFSVDGFLAIDLKYIGQLASLQATKTLYDNLKIYLSTEQFNGKITTPIGVYRKNDRYIGGLKLAL